MGACEPNASAMKVILKEDNKNLIALQLGSWRAQRCAQTRVPPSANRVRVSFAKTARKQSRHDTALNVHGQATAGTATKVRVHI